MVRVKSIDGFLSKWYTNDAAENMAHTSTKALETFSASLGNDQNGGSILSFEKAGADLIPHFCPSNLPPIAVLKTDRKRIIGGINNRAISNIEAGGTTYPLLYVMTDGSTTTVSVKLTVQGKHDRATREYTVTEVIDADADLNTATEIAKYCAPFNAADGTLDDSAEVLLRAELVKGTALDDDERLYVKVFNAVTNLSGNADITHDDAVCVLSNGNPIADLNEPAYSVTLDSSESITKASNLSINNTYVDDDNLYNSTIQAQAAISSNQGNHADEFHDDLKIVSTSDAYNNTQISYCHDNLGHVKDADSRFYDFHRLLRLQVSDNYNLPTGMLDKTRRRSFVEHYDDDQYVSTVNSGPLRIPSNIESRGLMLFSNSDTVENSTWHDLTALSRTNATLIGASGTYILRHGADVVQSTTHTRTPHPKNHLLLCKTDLFDRVYLRLNNTYAAGDTPVSIQVTAQYAHKNGWKPLEIEDGTLGLKTSGGIKFKVPADWKKMTSEGIESSELMDSWTGPVSDSDSSETFEVTRFTFTNDDENRYGGKYVGIYQPEEGAGDGTGTTAGNLIVFWFNDGSGDSQPTVSGADAYVEVDIDGAADRDAIATAFRAAVITVDDARFTVGSLDTSGSNAFFDVTQLIVGATANAVTDDGDITIAIQTAGVSSVTDPSALWDFSAYAILLNFNVKASAAAVNITNVWPYNNSHSQLIKVIDGHHVSLNDIAIAQSISFNRSGKYVNMEDRFGRTEIRKLGASGGVVTFGSVDLGDTNAKGNRKAIKGYQQNATPVFLDVTHKSGEKTRFFGVITSMSEDHPVGNQFPKYGVKMQISYIIEMSSDGTLLTDKISIGGNINDTRQYISKS